MPTDTMTPAEDATARLAATQAELVDLERQLADLAAANRISEMEKVATQLADKRSALEVQRAVVAAVDTVAQAEAAAEQQREREAEAVRQRQAHAQLEATYAALTGEWTRLYVEAENAVVWLDNTIAKLASVAAAIDPAAAAIGQRSWNGTWREQLLRPVFFRARSVLRDSALYWLPGLNKALFVDDGTVSGNEPLVQTVSEVTSA